MTIIDYVQRYNVALDVEQLSHISGGDVAFERELLELYLDDAGDHLSLLKSAIAAQDLAIIEAEAHHIKGASANVGLIDIQRDAAELETAARQHQAGCLKDLTTRIEKNLTQLQRALSDRAE